MNEKLHKILYIALSLLLAVAFWLFVDNEQENTIERPMFWGKAKVCQKKTGGTG